MGLYKKLARFKAAQQGFSPIEQAIKEGLIDQGTWSQYERAVLRFHGRVEADEFDYEEQVLVAVRDLMAEVLPHLTLDQRATRMWECISSSPNSLKVSQDILGRIAEKYPPISKPKSPSDAFVFGVLNLMAAATELPFPEHFLSTAVEWAYVALGMTEYTTPRRAAPTR